MPGGKKCPNQSDLILFEGGPSLVLAAKILNPSSQGRSRRRLEAESRQRQAEELHCRTLDLSQARIVGQAGQLAGDVPVDLEKMVDKEIAGALAAAPIGPFSASYRASEVGLSAFSCVADQDDIEIGR